MAVPAPVALVIVPAILISLPETKVTFFVAKSVPVLIVTSPVFAAPLAVVVLPNTYEAALISLSDVSLTVNVLLTLAPTLMPMLL